MPSDCLDQNSARGFGGWYHRTRLQRQKRFKKVSGSKLFSLLYLVSSVEGASVQNTYNPRTTL